MRMHRFYFPESVELNQKLRLEDKRLVHQLTRVLRAQISDQILLFDGQGSEAQAVILEISSDEITVAIQSIEAQQNKLSRELHLYCAILKRDNFELVIQKATELGVHTIVPLLTSHVVKQGFRRDRLEAIMIEAAEQCGRVIVPILEPPVSFAEAIQKSAQHEQTLFCDIDAPALANITLAEKSVGIFVGPEGGWSEEERALAQEKKLTPVSINSNILRAETAAIVATALLSV